MAKILRNENSIKVPIDFPFLHFVIATSSPDNPRSFNSVVT